MLSLSFLSSLTMAPWPSHKISLQRYTKWEMRMSEPVLGDGLLQG